jgi:hypothetical protein
MKTLLQSIEKVTIVSNKLPTERLKEFFVREGFDCAELRQEPRPEYKAYSKSYLCLLNHKEAWKEALKHKFTLIVEEDFVPVAGFGKLPLPFSEEADNFGIAGYIPSARRFSESQKTVISPVTLPEWLRIL